MENKRRFPTLVRLLPYQIIQFGRITADLLAFFNWTDVVIICDDGATEMNVYFLLCRLLPQYLGSVKALTSLQYHHYNFVRSPNYAAYLKEAARFSRGNCKGHRERNASFQRIFL